MAKHMGTACSTMLRVFCLGLFSVFGLGASLSVASDALDYPGSKLEKVEREDVANRTVYLSAPKRVSNELRFEQLKTVSTELEARLLRLSDTSSIDAVYDFYKRTLSERGEVVFSCEHRACGTSTNWANKIFEIAKLTGRDDNQFYVAGTALVEGQSAWVSAYIVRNGRRQNYVYLSIMPTKEAGASISYDGESFYLPSEAINDKGNLVALRERLSARPASKLVVQVFTPLTAEYREYVAKSSALADEASSKFKRLLDLDDSRLVIIDSGPMPAVETESQVYYQFSVLDP